VTETETDRSFRGLPLDARLLTILVFIGAAGSLLVPAAGMRNPYSILLPLAAVAGSLVALFQYRLNHSGQLTNDQLHRNITVSEQRLTTGLAALWFLFAGAVLLFYAVNGYARSTAVNVLLIGLYLLPVSLILFVERARLILTGLLGAGLIHRMLIYFANPLPYGVDPHYHYGHTHNIATEGTLTTLVGTKELFAPFFHVSGAIGSVVFDIPVREGAIFFTLAVSITVVTTLFVYHLAARFWNQRAGLFASFLYLIGDHTTGGLLSLGTTEFGLLFFTLIIYGLVSYMKRDDNRYFFIFACGLLALNFTHHGSMFIVAIGVITFGVIGLFVWGPVRRLVNIAIISTIMLLFNWLSTALTNGDGDMSFLLWILFSFQTSLENLLEGSDQLEPSSLGFITPGPMAGSGYYDVVGLALLIFFAVFGTLYWVSNERVEMNVGILLGGMSGAILVLMFVGSVIGISSLVPTRWFKHLYVLFAVLGGVGLVGLYSIVGSNRSHAVAFSIVLLLAGPYAVFMTASPVSSVDDPVIDDSPVSERLAYTDQEAAMVSHALTYSTEEFDVVSDQHGWSPLRWDRSEDSPRISRFRLNIDENRLFQGDRSTMMLNREHMYTQEVRFDIWTEELQDRPMMTVRGKAPMTAQTFEGFTKAYDVEDGDCNTTSCGIYVDA